MKFDKVSAQSRYDELTRQAESIKAKAAPLRLERDKFAQESRAQEDRMNARIRKVEAGLFDIEQERAFLSRALGGRTS